MAEGFLRNLSSQYEVFSAGVKPTKINPLAIKVMAELDIDIAKQKAKSIDEFTQQEFDYVITLCDSAQKSCPGFLGKAERLHWDLGDPAAFEGSAEEKLVVFRAIRDQIKEQIKLFLQ